MTVARFWTFATSEVRISPPGDGGGGPGKPGGKPDGPPRGNWTGRGKGRGPGNGQGGGGGGGGTPTTSYDFTAATEMDIPTTADTAKLIVRGTFSANTRILLRITTDGFSTVATTNYAYGNWSVPAFGSANLNGAGFVELYLDYGASQPFDMQIECLNLATARYAAFLVDSSFSIRATGSAPRSTIGGGLWRQNTTINGIRVYPETGTFTGNVTVMNGE